MSLPPGLIIRAGTPGDAAFIQQVHEESIRGLGPRCYSRAEVESWASGLTLGGYVRAMNQDGERFLLAEPETAGGRLASFCSFAEAASRKLNDVGFRAIMLALAHANCAYEPINSGFVTP